MATYTYTINVYTFAPGEPSVLHGHIDGTVEAERYSDACRRSWPKITTACRQIEAETGKKTAVGDIHVERQFTL